MPLLIVYMTVCYSHLSLYKVFVHPKFNLKIRVSVYSGSTVTGNHCMRIKQSSAAKSCNQVRLGVSLSFCISAESENEA